MRKVLAFSILGSVLAFPALAQMPPIPSQDDFPTTLSPEEFQRLRTALGQLPYDTAQPFVAFLANAHEQSRPKPAASTPVQHGPHMASPPPHQEAHPQAPGSAPEAPPPPSATPAHPEPAKP